MNPTFHPALSAQIRRRDRRGLVIVAIAIIGILAFMFGCADQLPTQATDQQHAISQTANDIGAHAANAGTHADNAAGAVKDAQHVASGIPAAAPVVPHLNAASNELDAVKAEINVVRSLVAGLQGQVTTIADTVKSLTAANGKLAADNEKLTKQWNESWLGGKSWFWIHLIVGVFSVTFVGLFIAEFFFDAPIHPLTWIIMAAPFIAKLLVNVGKGAVGAVSSLVSFVVGFFKKKTTATTSTTTTTTAPATPVFPASGK